MDETFKMITDACAEKGCCGEVEIPTAAEQEALGALRSIKERVRAIKDRAASLEAGEEGIRTQELSTLRQDLEILRKEWGHWEEKRKSAARERMILLGHEKP